MKILITSDLHGLESAYDRFAVLLEEGNFDLGLVAGDLMAYPTPAELQTARGMLRRKGDAANTYAAPSLPEVLEHALQVKQRHLKNILLRANKPVVFIMGNGDGIIGNGVPWTDDRHVVSANGRRLVFGEYSVVGYQYTGPFVGGTFEKSNAQQQVDFRVMENLIDTNTIFLTHGPAWGKLDRLPDKTHVGSKPMREMLERRPITHFPRVENAVLLIFGVRKCLLRRELH